MPLCITNTLVLYSWVLEVKRTHNTMSGKAIAWIVVIIIVLVGGYWWWSKSNTTPAPAPAPTTAETVPAL